MPPAFPDAAAVVPVSSCHRWHRGVISWWDAEAEKRWRRGRRGDAIGPQVARDHGACLGELTRRIHCAGCRIGWGACAARALRERCWRCSTPGHTSNVAVPSFVS